MDHKSLSHYDIRAGSTVYLQDMGYLTPLRWSNLVINIGPPAIIYLMRLYHLDVIIYLEGVDYSVEHFNDVWWYEEGQAQRLASYMIYIHFMKIIFETLFIHRMSGLNIPFNRFLWKILFYWVGLGCVVGYTLFHPLYKPFFFSFEDVQTKEHGLLLPSSIFGIFVISEIMNLLSHWHFTNMENKMEKAVLRNNDLHELDAQQRARRNYLISSMSKTAILKDYGFSLVTCADWMWESISWLAIAITI
jgi:hypothetical protein